MTDTPNSSTDLRETAEPSEARKAKAREAFGLWIDQQHTTAHIAQRIEVGVSEAHALIQLGRELAGEAERAEDTELETEDGKTLGAHLAAVQLVVTTLEPFDPASRRRIVEWAMAWLGDPLPTAPALPQIGAYYPPGVRGGSFPPPTTPGYYPPGVQTT